MSYTRSFILFFSTFLSGILCITTAAGPQITIARYMNNADGALSFTFDDGSANQYTVGAPMLEQSGFRGTFFVIAGYTREKVTQPLVPGIPSSENWCRVSWEQWREMASRGHEIACHSMTHQRLPDQTDEALQREVVEAKELMSEKMGQVPLTFAYPYNDVDERVKALVMKHFIAAREYQDAYGKGMINESGEMNSVANKAVRDKSFSIVMIHGLLEEYAPLDTVQFRSHLNYCKSLVEQNRLWVGTFADIVRYSYERDSTKIVVLASNFEDENRVLFTAKVSLDTAVYSVPLTFLIPIGHTIDGTVAASQHGVKLAAKISGNMILVNGIPDGSEIEVRWGSLTDTQQRISARKARTAATFPELFVDSKIGRPARPGHRFDLNPE